MTRQVINGDMKVWDVILDYPETYQVFRRFGCPDMRQSIFAVSAHFMKVRWGARAHHIELDELLAGRDREVSETRH